MGGGTFPSGDVAKGRRWEDELAGVTALHATVEVAL